MFVIFCSLILCVVDKLLFEIGLSVLENFLVLAWWFPEILILSDGSHMLPYW